MRALHPRLQAGRSQTKGGCFITCTLQAKAQQQEEELTVASDRIAELQEQVASLEQLLSADLGPVEAEVSIWDDHAFHVLRGGGDACL